MSFPRYPKYKASDVDWLGEVPDHWEVVGMRLLEKTGNDFVSGPFGSSLGSGDYVESGIPVIRGLNTTLKAESRFLEEDFVFVDEQKFRDLERCDARPGDLIFTARGTVGKVGIVPDTIVRALISPNQLRFRPCSEVAADYLFFLFSSAGLLAEINLVADSVAQPNLNLGNLKSLRIPLPSRDEQTEIATFLDRETAKIDGLVAEQQRLIELLKEKRTAVISYAVTKGLNPNAPKKPSGIEWLGDVPEHWRLMSLGRVTISRCDGPFGSGLKSEHYTGFGVRVIRLQNIRCDGFDGSDEAFIDTDYYARELSGHDVVSGDVLIAGLGDDKNTVGRACVAPTGIEPAMVKADCFRYRLDTTQVLAEYVAVALSAGAAADAGVLSSGSTRSRIPLSVMTTRKLAVPPIEEQRQIVDFIRTELSRLDALTAEAQHAIDLLQERRTALISAATTGQIDVRSIKERQPVSETLQNRS